MKRQGEISKNMKKNDQKTFRYMFRNFHVINQPRDRLSYRDVRTHIERKASAAGCIMSLDTQPYAACLVGFHLRW